MPISSGTTLLNKYRILHLLGEGGMARVWLAEELAFGQRLVAIKEPRPNPLSDDAAEIELRYRREVQVCAALEQAGVPNIVRAITAEPTGDGLLLVMAYMPGGDLAELIKQHPNGLPPERAVAIALDVLAALAGAHSHPLEIVHRDVKPSNILFDKEGRAYLADFGLAQLAGVSGRSQLHGNQHPGTPQYMAPEQERSAGYLSPSADLYALGCVLWEMLTGKRYKRFKPGMLPGQERRDVPLWLDAVVVKALAEEPWERWAEAEEITDALRAGPMENARRHAEAERLYEQGQEHHRQENYEWAIADYGKAIELDPTRAHFYYSRGISYHVAASSGQSIGSFELAIADHGKAIELDPTRADFYWERGKCYGWLANRERAIADYSKAIEIRPEHAEFYSTRGNSHFWLANYEQAIADHSKAIELDPRRADFYQERATSYHRAACVGQAIGSREQAIADLSMAIELDPEDAVFYWQRGVCYHSAAYAGLAIGSFEKAISDHSKAIELDPKRSDFYWERGKSYQLAADAGQPIGSYVRAIADHDKAIEIDPERADFYNSRGRCYHQAAYAGQTIGSFDRAITDKSKAIDLDPRQAEFYYSRSHSYQGAGKHSLADADLARARELGYKD